MKIAYILFDRMTMQDLVGFYDAIARLNILKLRGEPVAVPWQFSWDFCAVKEEVNDELGLTLKSRLISPDLSGYDMVYVPGGWGTRALSSDEAFISWLQTAKDVKYKVSVCTGALLLGAAGFLNGKRATTNRSAYELLTPYCKEVVDARIVRDGNVFTGGGVATSIDLGLYVLESLTDGETARKVQSFMDYPYYRSGRVDADYTV